MIILESFFNIMKIQDIDVVLAARTALEVSMLVCFYVRNEFHPSAIYVCPLLVSILANVTKDVVKDFDVVLAAIAALEVRMLVSLSVRYKFQYFAAFDSNEFIC